MLRASALPLSHILAFLIVMTWVGGASVAAGIWWVETASPGQCQQRGIVQYQLHWCRGLETRLSPLQCSGYLSGRSPRGQTISLQVIDVLFTFFSAFHLLLTSKIWCFSSEKYGSHASPRIILEILSVSNISV